MNAEIVRSDLVSGCYRVTLHARHRMAERLVSDSDIKYCAVAARISEQEDGKFKIEGYDIDSDKLTLICAWDGETIVVTVF